MTIRHLKIFTAVVEENTMSKAAKKLYIAQPSVSQAIRELEGHYNALLFYRHSKKLYITEAGKLLYTYARQVISQFDLLEENMSLSKRREKFRIGATVSVGGSVLSPIVKGFRRTHPSLDVYAFVGNTSEIEERLLKMELDAAIVEGFIKSPELVNIPVVKDPLVLACSQNHPLAGKKSLIPEDLRNQEFAIRETGSGTRELLDNYLRKHDLHVTIAFEEHTPDALKNAVAINNCLTLISGRLLTRELREGIFKAFSNADGQWDRYFRIVYHKSKDPALYIESLKTLLASHADENGDSIFIQGELQM